MRRVTETEAVTGAGLRGDRYLQHVGYWSGVDECEVTFIEAEALEEVAASGFHVANGEHRRNIITRGIRLHELDDKQFAVGEAVFTYDRPRPPCRYIETLTQQPGLTRALTAGRGGICARVVRSGPIRVGDAVIVG